MSGDDKNEETVSDETQQPEADQTPEVQAEEPQPKQRRQRKPKVQEPSIGRMVRYVTAQHTVRPAVISRVDEDGEGVQLTVFNSSPNGTAFVGFADHDPTGEIAGTWHWPEFN